MRHLGVQENALGHTSDDTTTDVQVDGLDPELFRGVVEAAPIGLMSVNAQGTIVLVNRQIELLFGYRRAELVGQPVETLIPERFRGHHPAMRKGYAKSPTHRRMGGGRDLFGLRKDGSEFPIEIGLSPDHGVEGRLVHCSVVDVSARKADEQKLRTHVDELQRNRSEAVLLDEMTSLLQYARDREEALQIASEFGQRLFLNTAIGIYLLPESGDHLELAASWNAFSAQPQTHPNACWGLRRAQMHRSGPGEPISCAHLSCERPSTCVPISAHGQWLGILNLVLDETAIVNREHWESIARTVADQVVLALSNLRLRAKLEDLALCDELTGLYNRRYLEETAPREVRRCIRDGASLGVIMLDIDKFKCINDSHGHQYGDRILTKVAKVLASGVRAEDVACRYGGEEFVLLLPNSTLANTTKRAEALRRAVNEATEGRVTCSAGVTTLPEHASHWPELLRCADNALYRAKDEGRDRVVVSAATPRCDEETEGIALVIPKAHGGLVAN